MIIRTIKQNNYVNRENETKGKVIISPSIARQILHNKVSDDVRIIDIKPDHSDRSGVKSVYVFEDNEDFQKTFENVMNNRQTRPRNNIVNDDVVTQITEAVLTKIKAEQTTEG